MLKRFTSLDLPSASSAGRKGANAALSGPHHGLFTAALTRLVRQCLATGGLTKCYRPPAQGLPVKYTVADVALLAETDPLHDTLSGPATQHLL